MGKVAKEYVDSRSKGIERTRHVDLLVARGLVPVGDEFAKIAEGCLISPELDPNPHDEGTKWVPAWFFAAWHAFDGTRSSFKIPTKEFKEYVDSIRGNEREKMLLLGELLISKPFQSKDVLRGIKGWIERAQGKL
jgi:hypothetical protein